MNKHSETRRDIIRASTVAWIKEHEIRNERGKLISFDNHFFLYDIYTDRNKKIAIRKPSQIGMSTLAILRSIHDARYWGINQIHTLPTVGDVQKFVPSKVNEIIKANPAIRKGLDKENVDSVQQKQFGRAFIYYKGTIGTSETLMLTSDRNIYDELDHSDMTAIGNYASRLQSVDSLGEEWYFSTPTVPNFGIDAVYQKSDQKHWRFACGKCGHVQHLDWYRSVDHDKKVYRCEKCGAVITPQMIRKGKWEAKYPGREISGYWLNQMIVPWKTCADLIQEEKDAENDDQKPPDYFPNHILGMPHLTANTQIQAGLIYKNLVNKPHTEVNSCMGVDVQLNELYAIIGNKEGVWGILRIPDKKGKSKWERLGEIMDIYDVRLAVIDGGYTPNEVMDFAKTKPYKVYVNWYKDNPKKDKIIRFGDEDFTGKQKSFAETIKILTERDRMIDLLVKELNEGKIPFLFNQTDPALQRLVKHVQTTYSRTVTDRRGIESREWISTGKDDLLHALIYWKIAMIKSGINSG